MPIISNNPVIKLNIFFKAPLLTKYHTCDYWINYLILPSIYINDMIAIIFLKRINESVSDCGMDLEKIPLIYDMAHRILCH